MGAIYGREAHQVMKKWAQSDIRFCKNVASKRSKNNEKEVNKIENQERNLYKLLQKCKMTDICETINQHYVQLSLEPNVIEINQFVYPPSLQYQLFAT